MTDLNATQPGNAPVSGDMSEPSENLLRRSCDAGGDGSRSAS